MFFETASICVRRTCASEATCDPLTTSRVVSSIALMASVVSDCTDLISVMIRLVASVVRSASRSTSSATTAKPLPASPAIAA